MTQPIAMVTGAAGGIGRATVHRLQSAGWQVAAATRRPDSIADLDTSLTIEADFTDADQAHSAMAQCAARLGRGPDRLLHSVGNTLIKHLHRSSAAEWREVIRVNLDSAFNALHAWIEALDQPDEKVPGAAVLISSVVARIGVANHEAIAAAKGGIEALVRSAAATYAGRGLRINAVAPGMTETPLTASMLKTDTFRAAAGRQYPLGGVQTAEDVAETIYWLLSDGAARQTGQVIPVDGGFTTIRPLVR